ncbi:hypothetical protein [Natranaerofaba carboxydovora]|uniref:hypothetical protein n=1 Tax=Natranaerofaba carboxydovora TaxID=2742683 RepID=UPI001F147F94|nr:hypothetical protein [Natranaerofaba carboxydovora]UMZ72589.1 hypothetical protein ACONDI_00113 [Natranaerofaba carboxydovora]
MKKILLISIMAVLILFSSVFVLGGCEEDLEDNKTEDEINNENDEENGEKDEKEKGNGAKNKDSKENGKSEGSDEDKESDRGKIEFESSEELVEENMDRIIEALEENWEVKGGKDLSYPEDIEIDPDDFDEISSTFISPDENYVGFVLLGPYHVLTDSSAAGLIDLRTDEIIITNIFNWQLAMDEPLFDNEVNYFAYTVVEASSAGSLHIDSIKEEKNIKTIDREKLDVDEELIAFANLEWNDDNELLFSTYDVDYQLDDIKKEDSMMEWKYNPEEDEVKKR